MSLGSEKGFTEKQFSGSCANFSHICTAGMPCRALWTLSERLTGHRFRPHSQ